MALRSLSIGQQRLRVVLQEPVETADDIGGVARSFAPRITLWARLEPVSGTERADAQQAGTHVSHRLSVRWRGDVTGAMRFVIGTRVFDIRGQYDPDGMRRTLVCLVEEARP